MIVSTTRALGYREGLTVVVGWDPGVVARPTAIDRAGLFLRGNWMLALPLFVFVVMYGTWRRVGRAPRLRPITVRYEPPEGLTPCEVGTLLEMERAALAPHEWELYNRLFDGRDSVRLSALENEFYKYLPDIRDRVYGRLVGRGYYRGRPDRVRAVAIVASVLAVGLIATFAMSHAFVMGHAPVPAFVGSILSVLVAAFFGYHMPARTRVGARALEHVLGFEEFLRRVESDRLQRTVLTPAMFEANLPHAMALGLEKHWASAFDDIYTAPPRWYQGGSVRGFRASHFVDSLGHMSTRAAAVMTAAPRGAGRVGGSGFSAGGGFSGGGFGGGSVGGF